MQKHKIFTIHDAKAACYLPPFILQTTGLAIRAITECANNPEHNFGRYPADYTLFEIGTFHDADGMITPYPAPKLLGICLDFVTSVPPVRLGAFTDPEHKAKPLEQVK